MSSPEDEPELDSGELYQQSFLDHARLQHQLPEGAVESLAREVIRRLTQKSQQVSAAAEDIEALAAALIGPQPKAAAALVTQYLQRGVDVDSIYISYLAQAAHRLGTWWESDHRSFAEVTVGIGRIYAIMRSLRPLIAPPETLSGKSAIFASVPEDQHTLGVKMASDLARENGWEIELLLDYDHDALLDGIVSSGQLLVGLSGAGEHSVPALARVVLALRISQPQAMILVSGNVVEAAGEAVRLMHVDAIARRFEEAMAELDRLRLSLQPRVM